jgi:CheY-like chemotaxis protein
MTSKSILVVEDDADVREAVAAVLESAGYRVVEAEHGRAALERLRDQGSIICLILLDLFMPEMNGWAFRSAQMQDPALASIPVLVLSADSMAAQRAVTPGVIAALTKPVEFDQLLRLVAQHC